MQIYAGNQHVDELGTDHNRHPESLLTVTTDYARCVREASARSTYKRDALLQSEISSVWVVKRGPRVVPDINNM